MGLGDQPPSADRAGRRRRGVDRRRAGRRQGRDHRLADYAPTPLHDLAGLAGALGFARLFYKDESARFTLRSFKALGGAYAVIRQAQAFLKTRLGETVATADIRAGRYRDALADWTVCTATDGNHGRSVAWGAQMIGCRAVIYIHAEVSAGRQQAMEGFGAEVRQIAGNYDDSVRIAAETAAEADWVVVSDTSWPATRRSPPMSCMVIC